MLDKNLFKSLIKTLVSNFDLDKSEDDVREYCQTVYPFMEKLGVDDALMQEAVGNFILQTGGSNFNKLPSVGDFAEILGLKPKTLDVTASEQAELAFARVSEFKFQGMVLFADPVTNYVIEKTFGGLAKFAFDYGDDSSNLDPKDPKWGKKDFIEAYTAHNDMGHKKLNPIYKTGAKVDSKILYIGDINQCNQNIAIHNERHKQLENNRTNETVQQITNGYKAT